jgi:hypothetical protein
MRDFPANASDPGGSSGAGAGHLAAGRPTTARARPLAAAQRAAAQRAADRNADAGPTLQLLDSFPAIGRHPVGREECLPAWPPVLPAEVPQCSVCGLPSTGPRCAGCEDLVQLHGTPLDTLEFLAIVEKGSVPEKLIWDWKNESTVRDGVVAGPHDWLIGIAAALSAYCEAHADRLLAGTPVITAIASRAPLIASAFQLAADRGWFALEVNATGQKSGTWLQDEMPGEPERPARSRGDWLIQFASAPRGPIVLFDDVFVSGASMFAYAAALRQAGATEIRSVCIGRQVPDTHWDYWDAARVLRRTGEFRWAPEREVIHRIAAVQAGDGKDVPARPMRAERIHGGSRSVNGAETQSRK